MYSVDEKHLPSICQDPAFISCMKRKKVEGKRRIWSSGTLSEEGKKKKGSPPKTCLMTFPGLGKGRKGQVQRSWELTVGNREPWSDPEQSGLLSLSLVFSLEETTWEKVFHYSQSCDDLWRKVNRRWLRLTSSMGMATWKNQKKRYSTVPNTFSQEQLSSRTTVNISMLQ